jgi:transcriptional regulator with XRE-family HTH domain
MLLIQPASRKRLFHSADHQRLVALLRQIREEAGLRQVDLAERLNRHQSFVSKYETGERRLDLVELRDICDACEIALSILVHRFETG